ncbi:MAG: Gfo/Idh/MocA family oxidoreductase [Silicimonas sp.]|nr:Gfo/Idh/MocA family oxidoreductase [Silicimonas sp.]
MRIGVVGAGKVGKLRAESVKSISELELVGVLEQAPELADAAVTGTGALATSDMDAFLGKNPEIVIISTPPHTHRELAEKAFSAGAHVLCEKPLAHSVEDGRAMVDAANKADRRLATGFNFRYYPFVKVVREAVDRGQIGKITHVRAFGGHNGLHNFSAEWQYKMPHSGGGAMMDIGIHITDLARYFLNDIVQVSGVMSETVWNVDGSEDNAMAVFRNPEGVPASYHATWYEWKGYRTWIEVYGDKGMARGAYAPMQSLIITRDETGRTRKKRRFFPEVRVREKLKSWQATALLSFEEELRDFVAKIRHGYDAPLADGHDGLRALEVSEAVRESTRSGQTVHLEPLGRMA